MPDTLYEDREAFIAVLNAVSKKAEIKLRAPIRNAILRALSERDDTATICRNRSGEPEPDPKLRDFERVPLPDGDDPVGEDGIPESVRTFFDREVMPHAPRRLDRHEEARPSRREGRARRVRDQLQPVFLPVQAAAAPWGDRGGHPADRGGDGGDVAGGGGGWPATLKRKWCRQL